jgi:ABC-type Fe3+-citrate transport system substrate-binding protein
VKKLWFLLSILLLLVGLTACAEDKSGEKEEQEDIKDETTDSVADAKKALVKFYMKYSDAINQKDADLNAYELSEEAPTAEMKAKAGDSAAAVAEELKTVQFPEELKEQKADLEAALKDINDSYIAKAAELKKEKTSLDAANTTFTQGEEKLGKVFESLGLGKPSLNTEVNS